MANLDVSKLRKKLAKKLKLRERQPRPQPTLISKSSSTALMKRMARDHQDVLQNIEFAAVSTAQENEDVDDVVVLRALKAVLIDDVPDDPGAAEIFHRLGAIRQSRSDNLSDEIWNDGIRVVMDSVRNHSRLRPGDTGYLDFVSRFIR